MKQFNLLSLSQPVSLLDKILLRAGYDGSVVDEQCI
jgi:hypothetical protein